MGILDQFGRLYVLSNEVDRETGRRLHEALILRNRARYDPRATLTKEQASKALECADNVVEIIERMALEKGASGRRISSTN